MWRKIFNIFSWLLILAYLVVSLAFTRNRLGDQVFRTVRVTILDSADIRFVRPADVTGRIVARGIQMHGLKMEEMNRHLIKETVLTLPGVRTATVYYTPEGVLNIDVTQRKPLMRYTGLHDDFYIDTEGVEIPLSPRHSERVLVVTGDPGRKFLADSLRPVVEYIGGEPFLDALIHGIHVHPDHTLELLARVGDHRIFMGSADDYSWKLSKLRVFYEKGLPVVGWDLYNRIDLRYSNQVVAGRWNEAARALKDSTAAGVDTVGMGLGMDEGMEIEW